MNSLDSPDLVLRFWKPFGVLPRSPAMRRRITEGHHPRTYLVLVEREPDPAALAALAAGIDLKDGPTRPVTVVRLTHQPNLPEREVWQPLDAEQQAASVERWDRPVDRLPASGDERLVRLAEGA